MRVPAARHLDAALEWAPAGRRAVPAIVLLVVVANLIGVGTVALLLLGLTAGVRDAGGRTVIVLTALAYLAVAIPIGVLAGLRLQRPTLAWLTTGRRPTAEEAERALRLPVDTASVAALTWLGGGLLVGTVGAVVSPFPLVGLRIALAAILGGVVSAGVSYLLTLRVARGVTVRALQAHRPPDRWVSASGPGCC